MRTISSHAKGTFTPEIPLPATNAKEELFKTFPVDEQTVEDDVIIDRLNSIIQNIRDGIYDDETKQAIYHYAECYQKEAPLESNEFVVHARDLLKNYITGWWVHQLIENSDSVEEKLTPQRSGIENNQ